MNSEEIKKEVHLMYDQIKVAEDRLKELRNICPHKNTYDGLYQWRIGGVYMAIICSDCGEPVGHSDKPMPELPPVRMVRITPE